MPYPIKNEPNKRTQRQLLVACSHQSLQVTVCKKLCKCFCGSRGSCIKFDKFPQVMSFESVLVGLRDYKVESNNATGVY